MNRRAFIAALGGAAVWPLTANAQQGDRMRRVGVLMNTEIPKMMRNRGRAWRRCGKG
jgi:hypothetical protein